MPMPDKARRRRRILELVARGGVHNQERLRELLATDGIAVTQATLSRDLRELSLVKGPAGYTVPGAPQPHRFSDKELVRALRSHLLAAQTAGNLIVLKTAPGHAQALAVEIDAANLSHLVGCLAGDDTIFIAASTPAHAVRLANHLKSLSGAS